MRYAIGIEYDGTDFLGWQRLSHGDTLQARIEAALSCVADAPVTVTCAGRTDAGVHARCQVAHFDSDAQRDSRAWQLGATSRLPHAISLRWAQPVADDFHARYGAVARRYRYRILNRSFRPAIDARHVTWERRPLDAGLMHIAAQALVGEHDYTSFRTAACQARSPVREIHAISVERVGEVIDVNLVANAFLHHMVRNIVGSLLPVGRGERSSGWIAELLALRDRDRAGATAPAQGLTFLGPLYPRDDGLPDEVSTDLPRRTRRRTTEGGEDD
jgi:tRNA pseudouridine38-40 synthase